MIQKIERPGAQGSAIGANIEAFGWAIDSSNNSENLTDLQAAWLSRRYPISAGRARLVADLLFGRAA